MLQRNILEHEGHAGMNLYGNLPLGYSWGIRRVYLVRDWAFDMSFARGGTCVRYADL